MSAETIQKYMRDNIPLDELRAAVEDLVSRGLPLEDPPEQTPSGGFSGSVGFVDEANVKDENGFCYFCYFCEPDLSKNPIFPTDEFSRELRNFSVCASASLQVATDMGAVSALAMTSICAQRKFKVHPLARHYEPVNIYAAIVAKPSERKSPTLALAAAPLYEYQREENERRRARVEEYRDRRDMLLRRIESLKRIATSGRKAKNAAPTTVEDVSLLRRGDRINLAVFSVFQWNSRIHICYRAYGYSIGNFCI